MVFGGGGGNTNYFITYKQPGTLSYDFAVCLPKHNLLNEDNVNYIKTANHGFKFNHQAMFGYCPISANIMKYVSRLPNHQQFSKE